MKVKITSIWIPITLILVLTVVIIVLNLLVVFNEEVLNMMLAFFGLVFLSFFYFPRLSYVIIKKNDINKENIINNIGLLCVLLWVLAFVFMLMHVSAAAALVILGAFFFIFNYLPAWYYIKYKESDKRRRVLFFLMCTFYGWIMVYVCAKTMHYPFVNFAGAISVIVFCTLLLPYLIYLAFKKDLRFNFKEHFIFIFFLGYIISNYQDTKVRERIFSSIKSNQELAEKNLALHQNKSNFIYDAFFHAKKTDTLFIAMQMRARQLRRLSANLADYIQCMKANIVSKTNEIDMLKADTMKFENIRSKTNVDVPTFILFGSDMDSLADGEYTALDLRKKIKKYSDNLIPLLPEESVLQFKQSNPLEIIDHEGNEDGVDETWEIMLFFHRPLGEVFTKLTSLQADVRYAEMLVLNELFNKASSNNKSNVAAQLAELSAKYESEKKEKEIGLLQKDKELNDAKLHAKDLAISKKEQTIIYFVLALVGFVVLIVFVIRANILRKKANQLLTEQKIEISNQKQEVENQKHLVDEKNKEITDSITYAKRLQEAILPPQQFISKYLPDNFILYKPKDLVAGDFYWAEKIGDSFYIAAADSTGHGVPGAMVSVVCSNALNRTVKEFKESETGKILDKTRELVLETFEKSTSEVKDGMDISLICIDTKNKKIFWSGANNPLWYIQENKLQEIKADKQPIGKSDYPKPFTTHSIEYKENTTFYLFTDGFADQFGGPNGKKFKYKQFSDFLLSISHLHKSQQMELIDKRFSEWKGTLEQVDDVCIIGISI